MKLRPWTAPGARRIGSTRRCLDRSLGARTDVAPAHGSPASVISPARYGSHPRWGCWPLKRSRTVATASAAAEAVGGTASVAGAEAPARVLRPLRIASRGQGGRDAGAYLPTSSSRRVPTRAHRPSPRRGCEGRGRKSSRCAFVLTTIAPTPNGPRQWSASQLDVSAITPPSTGMSPALT